MLTQKPLYDFSKIWFPKPQHLINKELRKQERY